MFTVVGWAESAAGATSYGAMAALTDQHVTVSGNIIYVPALNHLVGVHLLGGTIADEAYLSAPSLRRLALRDIAPIEAAVSPAGKPMVNYFPLSPVVLEPGEGLELWTKETAATSEIRNAIALLADGPLTPVTGNIFTVLVTATITTVTGQWVNGALTFSQTLPVGRYQLVGARCKGATVVGFRFVPIGALNRPGGAGVGAVGTQDPEYQRYGGLGVWCEFDSRTPPTVELTGGTAGAQSAELYLDLIKIA